MMLALTDEKIEKVISLALLQIWYLQQQLIRALDQSHSYHAEIILSM